ncbi:MAG: ATP-dependent DNA ligase [Propionicimonas sp.]|uniref:ATP-dependent DNA ligase n=1 Tax=Propionicimonas sp. TaxID=1955623 RepID=UPI002B21A785|nr:ATP-dependent DNA ligase [Propionicimonas sp.]MEA4945143.1 ATP-dependent DNA ligase [Propionicimonas sp.]
MLFSQVVAASAQVAATSARKAKIAILAGLLAGADPAEVDILAHFLAGRLRQRRTGIGWRSLRGFTPAGAPSLTLTEVDGRLEQLSRLEGAGSQLARQAGLAKLMELATENEQRFLAGLIVGETRQGALEGVLLQAIAEAFAVPAELVRRAAMFAGSAPAAAVAAARGGAEALAEIRLEVGRPVQPMLASSASSVAAALERLGPSTPVAVETKLDGIRIQAHKSGSRVAIYSRSLDDITVRLPEVAAQVAALPCDSCVLDGEALVIGADGRPRLFQESSSRAATHSKQADPGTDPPAALSPFFFDLLAVDGEDLVDSPTAVRYERLAGLVPGELRVGRTVTADVTEAEDFSHHALAQGHEGVVIKALDLPYQAGRRGAGWVKVKPVHTLDLVVLAVERGSGRRKGWLSNIHLGARDPATGGFVMLGKTFKGMTDEMLAWQTERFTALATDDNGWVVQVRPEQVVEIAFDGIQRSPRYPGGVALRFARVVRYRDDKTAAEADTLDTVLGFAR